MNFAYFKDDWKKIDDLAEPANGRTVYAGGFVFGDTFDVFLRSISEDYLRAAWLQLSQVLDQYNVVADDLSWGWMHPGETGFDVEVVPYSDLVPSAYLG